MPESPLQLSAALSQSITDKRIDILRRIGEVGSISEAARAAGVSYKAAWQAIETLSNLAGSALLEKLVGGSGGGGARLTAAGERLLQAADILTQARMDALARLEHGHLLPGVAALSLRTSMRNQLPCVAQALRKNGHMLRVELALADDTRLFSRITRESAELLGLHPGQAVLALCKATAITVAQKSESRVGHNLLPGTVTRAARSSSGGEIAMALHGGLQLVGFAAVGHQLRKASLAVACLEESAVVLAVTD